MRNLCIALGVLGAACGDNAPPEDDAGMEAGRCTAVSPVPGPTYECTSEIVTVAADVGFFTMDAGLGDLDGDGQLDAVLSQNTMELAVVWGVWQEQLVDKRSNLQSVGGVVTIGDLTNDAIDDIVMAASSDHAYVLAGTSDRTLMPLPAFAWAPTDGVNLVDVNGDGALDLVGALTSRYRSGVLQTVLNDGTGRFAAPVISALGDYVGLYGRVATGDIDCDGNVDLAVPALNLGPMVNGVEILLGDGSGHFTSQRWYEGASGQPFLADVDGNGSPDLIMQSDMITVAVRRGVGDGSFGEPELYGVAQLGAITVGDVTGDAMPDIVTASIVEVGASQPGGYVHVLENSGGAFRDAGRWGEMRFWRHVALGDIDADGHNDIIATDEGGTVQAVHQVCTASD